MGDNGHRSKYRGEPCRGCHIELRLARDPWKNNTVIHQKAGWCTNCARFGTPPEPGKPKPRPQWVPKEGITVHGLDSDDPNERNNALNLLAYQLRRRKRNAPIGGVHMPGDDDLDPLGRPKQ